MGPLTQEERDTVAEYPLGDDLEKARSGLLSAFRDKDQDQLNGEAEERSKPDTPIELESQTESGSQSEPEPQADSNIKGPRYQKVFAAAIVRLLSALSASQVAISLTSRTGRDSLLSDLGLIRMRVAKGDIEYQHYRPLSQLVIRQAPEIEIWDAVVTLVCTITHSTPPPSVVPSFDGTPIMHSSASLQGSEQTRRKVEPRIFEEICSCTHRGVEGFHAKYFESKSWSKHVRRVWKAAKDRHDGERWKGLPDVPTQEEVYTWWFDLQKELPVSAKSGYYQTRTGDMQGDAAARQLDLLVKAKGNARDARLDWKDVAVVGELTQSQDQWRAKLLQLGRYVRDIFTNQPTRRFVHAFSICGAEMETWVFDRSGPYSAPTFDIHAEPERFIQVFCGYVMMSNEELGLDTLIKRKAGKQFVAMPMQDSRGKKRKRELELASEPLAVQRAIVCRGTTCYRAKVARKDDFDCVVKFSWVSDKRPPEADLLQKANDRGVEGLAKLVAHDEVTSVAKLREGLQFAEPHRFRAALSVTSSFSQSQASQFQTLSIISHSPQKRKSFAADDHPSKRSRSTSQLAEHKSVNGFAYPLQEAHGTSLVQRSNGPFENRILRVLATSPAGRAITQFTSISELFTGIRDTISVHRSLYMKGSILHRDISLGNLILTSSGGMLIDLDLGKEIGQDSSGARHRTGTMEFMAIQVLEESAHTYRHDLESFFYVLVWLCARQGWHFSGNPKGQPKDSLLPGWYTGKYKEIARNKRGDMVISGFEQILREFPPKFDCIKPCCRKLRDILFPIHNGDLFTGTPENPESLYDPIIKVFDEVLDHVSKEKLS